MRYLRYFLLLNAFILTVSATPASAVRDSDGAWSVLSVTGDKPSARKHHTMVYDEARNRVILYGGENQGASSTPLTDLWVLYLDGTPYWSEIDSVSAAGQDGSPPGLHGHAAAYDPDNDRMIIFAGRTDYGNVAEPAYSPETWALDLDTYVWSQLTDFPSSPFILCYKNGEPIYRIPEQRTHSVAGTLAGDVYIMGGLAGSTAAAISAVQDTWKLASGWSHTWGEMQLGEAIPPNCSFTGPVRRLWHAMIRDDANDRLVLFGGWYPNDSINFADTWYTTDGTAWTAMSSASTGLTFHTAAYDPVGQRMLVLGGYQVPPKSNITANATALSLPASGSGTWSSLSPSGSGPGSIAEHSAVYDNENDGVIVFGGVFHPDTLRGTDTYVLDFSDVTPPAAVTLSAGLIGKYGSTITWTAPGDDGTTGTAASYDLRRLDSPIDESTWSSATPLSTDPPSVAGSSECAGTGPNITPCRTYYYALKTTDAAGNVSALSNSLSIKQKCSGASYVCGGLGPVAATPTPVEVEYSVRGANPAATRTSLLVSIPAGRAGDAMEIAIFDVTGARVRSLIARNASPGDHEFVWDLRSDSGTPVAGGIYFARLRLGNETRTHKIVVSIGR